MALGAIPADNILTAYIRIALLRNYRRGRYADSKVRCKRMRKVQSAISFQFFDSTAEKSYTKINRTLSLHNKFFTRVFVSFYPA